MNTATTWSKTQKQRNMITMAEDDLHARILFSYYCLSLARHRVPVDFLSSSEVSTSQSHNYFSAPATWAGVTYNAIHLLNIE